MNKKPISYLDPLPLEHIQQVLKRADQASHNLEQQINKTNMAGKKTNNNTQTKMTWTETNRWIVAVVATLGIFGLLGGVYVMGWLIHFALGTLLIWLLFMIVLLVKHLVDELIDWNE